MADSRADRTKTDLSANELISEESEEDVHRSASSVAVADEVAAAGYQTSR